MSAISETLRRLVGGDRASATGPVQAVWRGAVIAESDRTVVVEGNHYFPPEDVHPGYLQPSARQTTCPWKGRASYYDVVVVDGERNKAAAWFYPEPSAAAAKIRNRVAFWRGVKVRRAEA